MPKEAFKSLWETVKSGKIWTGYVKNATKNGDFYWVFATVYPTIIDNGEKTLHACSKWDRMDNYDEWLKLLKSNSKKETVQDNYAVTTQFFGVRERDNKIVGMINIRHELANDFLRNYGGNIGYGIRPTERRKGYATQMLEQALKYCKEELNLEKVMLGCYKENEASRRTILNAGGALEREVKTENGKIAQVYWIKL